MVLHAVQEGFLGEFNHKIDLSRISKEDLRLKII